MPASSLAGDKRERRRRVVALRLWRYARIALVVVGLFPWLLPLARAYLPLGILGDILVQLCIVLCHRLDARTITLAGVAMPMCSRCAGIFGGLALAGLLDYPRVTVTNARWLLLASCLLMIADVVRQDFYTGGVLHPLRILTGVCLGFSAALGLLAALRPTSGLAPTTGVRPTS